MRLNSREFDRIVSRALERLPSGLSRYLDNVAITVEQRPSRDLLQEMGLPPDEPLLGLYTGIALTERSASEPPLYPDSIVLYKACLEEICNSVAELQEEIEITVAHEIAHFFGISEERLAELGYD